MAADVGEQLEREKKILNQLEHEKVLGNDYFKKGQFADSLVHYSNALQIANGNHVLYSNRSACYSQLGRHTEVSLGSWIYELHMNKKESERC